MSLSVLIVDDHAGFRTQARMLLEAAGYEVIGEAEDGASGDLLISSREASEYGGRVRRSGARGFISKADLSTRAPAAILEPGS